MQQRASWLLVLLTACGTSVAPPGPFQPDAGHSSDTSDAGLVEDAGESDEPDAGEEIDHGEGEPLDAGEEADAGHEPEPVDAGEEPAPVDAGTPPGHTRAPFIDAAVTWGNGKIYFFRGADYIRYDFNTDAADPGYPKRIATYWPGVFERDLDTAFAAGGKIHFFKGDEYVRFDIAADRADPGYPVRIADAWPGLFERDLDAAISWGAGRVRFVRGDRFLDWDLASGAVLGTERPLSDWPGVWPDGFDAGVSVSAAKNYLFRGREYLRYDQARTAPDAGYPKLTACNWPGLWNPYDGTGRPGPNLPSHVAGLLGESPDTTEIAARKARVAASVTSGWLDRSPQYPQYLASVEERLGAWGCLLLKATDSNTWRYRCATNTSGPRALDVAPFRVEYIDWRRAAYHTQQVSQGDFLADPGTPLSILRSDDGVFRIVGVYADAPTGSISGGFRVRVRFRAGGADRDIQFSHLNTAIPRYVLDAATNGTPLPVGTAFGFIGYTGNLWIAPPPATDQPYSGTGAGLPDAHTHVWFVNQAENHQKLAPWAREALDFCGSYPYGGG